MTMQIFRGACVVESLFLNRVHSSLTDDGHSGTVWGAGLIRTRQSPLVLNMLLVFRGLTNIHRQSTRISLMGGSDNKASLPRVWVYRREAFNAQYAPCGVDELHWAIK